LQNGAAGSGNEEGHRCTIAELWTGTPSGEIIYCKDDSWKKTYPNEKFDFLGYSVLQKHTDKEFIMN
jgi:hypothetical protein